MTDSKSSASDGRLAVVGKVLLLGVVLFAATRLGRLLRQRPDQRLSTVEQRSDISTHNTAAPLYMTYCGKCHGPNGHGDPESVARLNPPPRDFAKTNWRFAKTQAEISRVIREGIQGTAMPAMGHVLSEQQTALLTDYVLQLSEEKVASRSTVALRDDLQALKDLGFTVYENPAGAPSVNLTSSTEESFELANATDDLIIINFWGTACRHCLEEMPGLVELENLYRDDGLRVLSVCADEDDLDVISKIANQIVPGYVVYKDDSGLMTQKYSVGALPTFVIIDGGQNVIARRSGAIDWSSQPARQAVHLLTRDSR